MLKPGVVINTIVVIGFAAVAVWRGYHRRRAYWSRGSWIRFGLTILTGLSLIGCMAVLTTAFDHHASWVGAPGSAARAIWVTATVSCMVAGSLLTSFSLAWFAQGNPTLPFHFFSLTRRAKAFALSETSETADLPEIDDDA